MAGPAQHGQQVIDVAVDVAVGEETQEVHRGATLANAFGRFLPDVERPLAQLSIIIEGRELLLRQGDEPMAVLPLIVKQPF